MKKSKNLAKSIGTVCLSALSLAGVCAGSIAFVDYAGTGFTGQRPQTEQTQNDAMAVTYDFSGRIINSEDNGKVTKYLNVGSYTGDKKQFVVPATVALGPIVDKNYTFAEQSELMDYITNKREELYETYGWDTNFEKPLSFVCANNTIVTAKNCQELQQVDITISEIGEDAFPVKHTGPTQTYVKGDDIHIEFCIQDSSSIAGVEKIKFESGITAVDYEVLVNNGVIIEFDKSDAQYGAIEYDNGYLIKNENELLKVYPDTFTADFVVPEQITTIGDKCFRAHSTLKSIDLKNVTKINMFAFADCINLQTVDLSNVTSIEYYAFSHCDKLASVTLSPDLQVITSNCFEYTAISNIDLSNVIRIEDYAFFNCQNLTNLTSTEQVEFLGAESVAHTAITSLVLPNIIELAPFAFTSCENLELVDLGENLSRISTVDGYGGDSLWLGQAQKVIIRATSIPQNENTSLWLLQEIAELYVPDELYEAYLADPHYSRTGYTQSDEYAQKIKKLSEYVA